MCLLSFTCSGKKGGTHVELVVKNDEDTYLYMLDVFDNGRALLELQMQEREGISYDGDVDLSKKKDAAHEREVEKQSGSPIRGSSQERQNRPHRDSCQHHGHTGPREGAQRDKVGSQAPQPFRRRQLQKDADLDHKGQTAEEGEKQPGIRT